MKQIKYFLHAIFFFSFSLFADPASKESGVSAAPTSTVSWIVPIDSQLQALRDNNIEKAYEGSSEEFKKSTSLKDFTTFVESYPILFNHTEIAVKSNSIKDNHAEVIVTLNPGKEDSNVHYQLIKQGEEWKIWGMNVYSAYSQAVATLLQNPHMITEAIEGHLDALKENNITKAYYEYTSSHFKEATSLDTFRQFLNSFPIFFDYERRVLKDPAIEKVTGHQEVELFEQRGKTTIEYTLGIEENQWKIWAIQVLKQHVETFPTEEKSQEPSPGVSKTTVNDFPSVQGNKITVEKIEVGTKLDSYGNLEDPKIWFRNLQGLIYMNLIISNGIAGTRVELRLEHLETHSEVPAISTTLSQSGTSKLSLSFSPPEQGWPKGHYLITVTVLGASKELNFIVE